MTPLEKRYFPLKQPFPERAALWTERVSYRRAPARRFDPWIHLTHYGLHAPSPETVGKRIALLSDLHWDNDRKSKAIFASAEKAIRESAPDYLILGGDIVGDADRMDSLEEILSRCRDLAKTVIAVNGNWETGKDWLPENYWGDLCRKHGLIHLQNQCWSDEIFFFAGVEDICRGHLHLPPPPPCGQAAVLLAHSPDSVIALDEENALSPYFLALCGHNHGGQIRIPLTGITLPLHSRYGSRFCCGLFRRKSTRMRMIVSTGLNEGSFPMRWNCRREVVVVHFRKPSGGFPVRTSEA